MAYIYARKIGVNENMPAFLPGMCCANFQGARFSFTNVDLSRLTDLTRFFADCPNLTVAPHISSDLTGRTGLDTMFEGCTNLYEFSYNGEISSSITFYSGKMSLQRLVMCINTLQPATAAVFRVIGGTAGIYNGNTQIAIIGIGKSPLLRRIPNSPEMWMTSYQIENDGTITATGDTTFAQAVKEVAGWSFSIV